MDQETCVIDGVRIWGRTIGIVTAADVTDVGVDFENSLHIARHFAELNRTSRDYLLSDSSKGVTESQIDDLLRTAGSKFNPQINNLQTTLDAIISFLPEAISKQNYSWIQFQSVPDTYFAEIDISLNEKHKNILGLKNTESVGTLGAILINDDVEPLLKQEKRGQGQETDSHTVNIIEGMKAPDTDIITIGLKKDPITGDVSLTSIFTSDGKLSPPFPNVDRQSKKECEYNSRWWSRYAFFRE